MSKLRITMKKEQQTRRQRGGGGGVHSSCWIGLLWICLFFCDSLPRADGFANNLIVTSVGCMTELDTSEVIMNNMVKAVDESDFPKMHLVVVDSQNNHIESPYHYSQQEIVVAFENPYTKEEFDDDLQYVMEILGPEKNDGDPPTNPDAEWIHGGTIGCDNNKRVAARIQDYDGRATIQIHNPTKLEILAGWATGQNSVRLTPKLVLEPSTPKEIKKDDQEHEQEKAEAEKAEAAVEGDAEILSKVRDAKNGKLLEVVEKVKSKIASKKKKEQEENINGIQIGEEDDENNKKGRKAEGHRKERKHEKDEDEEGENTIKVHNKEEFMEVAKKLKAKRESAAQQRSEELSHEVNSNENDDRQQSSSEDRPEMKPITHRNSIHKLQQQQLQQKQHETHSNQKKPNNAAAWNQKSEEIRRKQLEKQMNENFPDRHIRELQMRSYLFACSFYLICIGLILMMFSKKKEKGRRDL